MELHRSVLNKTSFPFHIGKREVLLHWFTDRSLFKLLELIVSIAVLEIVYSSDITKEMDLLGRRVVASSSGGAVAVYSVLWTAHLVGTPARTCLDAVFGIIVLLSSTACLYLTVDTYDRNTDLSVNEEQGTCAILILSIIVQLGDLACVLGCRNHKNCLYKCMFRMKQRMDARPRPMVNLRKKSTMYIREPTTIPFKEEDFIPIEENLIN